MGEQQVLVSTKKIASEFCDIITKDIQGVACTLKAHDHFPIRDGGECLEYDVCRARERVSAILLLGDPTSTEGPYNGKCWIIVARGMWLAPLRGPTLYDDICNVLQSHGATPS